MTAVLDYAHTEHAERRRAVKADRLAAAARDLGLMPFELAIIGGTPSAESRRELVRKSAGMDRAPSDETWVLALVRLEALALQVPGITLCPECDWPVLEVVAEISKRRILIDPLPRGDGTVLPVQAADGLNMLARVFAGGDAARPLDEPLYRQHSRSCPQSPQGRSVRTPKCEICGNPLWLPLVELDPTYTTHPTCDPHGKALP